ncbi:hypothetical protein [Fimbriiglobus ruber]|uniref:Uncharacterized protein n=1 Tax=Fimbriiglobus ruber TaxID=1908690 RepID=A0A225E475_9BACT|nr:hypothetical protein [Fimbriiglobus ruber]OWK46554.1 hypothetical protein FRUB_00253 [Fimbriiglobus ruber]
MTLTPTAVEKPLSRTYLLPEFRERIAGNRVQMFLRCFMEQDTFFSREESLKRQKWSEATIEQLRSDPRSPPRHEPKKANAEPADPKDLGLPPLAELRNYGGRLIERDMYDAARMSSVDWQLDYFLRRDGVNTLLPDVQKMRSLAQVLQTRVRGEIAARDFPAAIHTLKTMFALSQTMEPHPTLIGHLVGIAIGSLAVNALEEMIQEPGCPNMFWALVDLPLPLLSVRSGVSGERSWLTVDVEDLKNSPDPITDEAINRRLDRLVNDLQMGGGEPGQNSFLKWLGGPKALLQVRAKDEDEVRGARARLIKAGLKPEYVAVWTPLQVIFLDEVMNYEVVRDDMMKWMNLPNWQAVSGLAGAEVELKKIQHQSPLFSLLPAISRVRVAYARFDQRFAYLRVIEAIRLHAHENAGKLPASLADIKLPLPVDPVNGKPFEYSVKDGTATLHGANPHDNRPETNRYYEIRIKK